MTRYWKDAATLMIAAKTLTAGAREVSTKFDYKLLMLKRSSKSKFMSNAIVFPGGICDQSDFDKSWEPLIMNKAPQATSRLLNMDKVRPSMFSNPEFHGIHQEIGYRITAIRETFEETGIPLFLPSKFDISVRDPSAVLKYYGENLLSEWRKRVDNNNSEFMNMCIELEMVPHIWSLHTWSNWLTPTHMHSVHGKSTRRYDTMFYVCCLPNPPKSLHDDNEVVSSEWLDPMQCLIKNRKEEMWLAPPQIYEASRLVGMQELDVLESYAKNNEDSGCERLFPVKFRCNDGIITTLPGDSLHPEKPDFIGKRDEEQFDGSVDSSRESASFLHRFEFKTLYHVDVRCNIELPNKQLSPEAGQELIETVILE